MIEDQIAVGCLVIISIVTGFVMGMADKIVEWVMKR